VSEEFPFKDRPQLLFLIIWLAIAFSILIMLGISLYLPAGSAEFKPEPTSPELGNLLRIIFYLVMLAIVILVLVFRARLNSLFSSPQLELNQLFSSYILLWAFSEAPAVLGLVWRLSFEVRYEHFILFGVSFLLLLLNFPRLGAIKESLSRSFSRDFEEPNPYDRSSFPS